MVYRGQHAGNKIVSIEDPKTAPPSHPAAETAPKAAEALRLDAPNLLKLGVDDGVVKEPLGGAQEDPAATGSAIRKTLRDSLADLSKASPEKLIAMRYAKFRAMGVYSE